jgi:predicted CxxxxCH...CXXCH cytochrome family protein
MLKSTVLKMISLPLALSVLFACSGGNDAAPVKLDATGKHAAGPGYSSWVQQHWVEYKLANGGSKLASSATSCSECHGADLLGGTSKVSCFSASFKDSAGATLYCHPNGDRTLGHPASWTDPTSADFHAQASFNGKAVKGSATLGTDCGLCHATDRNALTLGTVPSCLSNDPKWGISCHVSSPAVSSNGCVSCHNTPPAGAVAPNQAGAHVTHLGLPGVTCATCHNGFGSGTPKHATGNGLAFVKLATGYQAQSGVLAYGTLKCSSVSCHGGQQTPAWIGETLDVANCSRCHALARSAAPQFNDYSSGKLSTDAPQVKLHQFHLAQVDPNTGSAITCLGCHDVTVLTDPTGAHFANLATSAFEGKAENTLKSSISYVKSTDSTNAKWKSSCTANCHFFNGSDLDPTGKAFRWKVEKTGRVGQPQEQ